MTGLIKFKTTGGKYVWINPNWIINVIKKDSLYEIRLNGVEEVYPVTDFVLTQILRAADKLGIKSIDSLNERELE